MAKHFLSFLGANIYDEVYYQLGDQRTNKKHKYVQAADLEFCKDQFCDGGAITIFLTNEARSVNWDPNDGLKSVLSEQFMDIPVNIEEVSIASNLDSEKAQADFFNILFGHIKENDDIIFDITHAFRSIPILALTVLNYARILKNCTISAIYYGAYEKGCEVAPIVDMSIYIDILSWANAAHAFTQYGIAGPMKDLFEAPGKSLSGEERGNWRRKWGQLQQVVDSIDTFTKAIEVSRGTDAKTIDFSRNYKKCAGVSIINAYEQIRDNINDDKVQSLLNESPFMKPLFGKVEEAIQDFNTPDINIYQSGIATVNWCIKHNKIQQGFTALEETVKTYLCVKYGISWVSKETRDNIIGAIVNGISHSSNPITAGERKSIMETIPMLEKDKPERDSTGLLKTTPKELAAIISDIPWELADLTNKIKNTRNDINHYGFRKDPKDFDKLKDQLNTYLNSFLRFVE